MGQSQAERQPRYFGAEVADPELRRELERIRSYSEVFNPRTAEFLVECQGDGFATGGGLTVLSIGIGPGTLLETLNKHLRPGRVIGVDKDPRMLRVAEDEAGRLGLGDKFTVIHGGAEAITPEQISPGSIDVVQSRLLIMNVPGNIQAPILGILRNSLSENGIALLEELDLADEHGNFTWRAEPSCHEGEEMREGIRTFYNRLGPKNIRTGSFLEEMCTQTGLEVVKHKLYQVTSEEDIRVKKASPEILLAIGRGVSAMHIIEAQAYAALLEAERQHIEKPEVVVHGPVMHQLAVRRI